MISIVAVIVNIQCHHALGPFEKRPCRWFLALESLPACGPTGVHSKDHGPHVSGFRFRVFRGLGFRA